MGTLYFVCPASGRNVNTGIEVDRTSFGSIRGERLGCPECFETHQLSHIKVWIADRGLPEPVEQFHGEVGGAICSSD